MEAMSAAKVQYHPLVPSQASLAHSGTTHTHTTLSTSNAHIQGLHGSSRENHGGGLGLIGNARVRLTKDFRALIRNPSSSSTVERRPQRIPSARRGRARLPGAEASLLHSPTPRLSGRVLESELETMDHVQEERRTGRGFGARLVGFLSRSRSRSQSKPKKRRSKSMDDIAAPASAIPKPFQGGSLGRQNPYAAQIGPAKASTSASASGAKPITRSPSRPLSSNTTATDATVKPQHRKLVRSPSNTRRMSPQHHVHLQADVLGSNIDDPSRKGKKTNFFSVAITSPRKYEQPAPQDSRPNGTPTPMESSQPPRRRWSGRFRSGSGSSAGTQSSRSNAGDREINQDTPPPVPPKPGSSSKAPRPRPLQVVPPARQATFTSLNSPPPPYRLDDDFENSAPDEPDLTGRCSPLCGLPSPRLTPPSSKGKGKEREMAWSPREQLREEKERMERHKQSEVGHPRRVKSPPLRERESRIDSRIESRIESRAGKAAPTPVEKVASGSGSGNSKKSSGTKDSGASAALMAKRTKHGSFDFERPMSATGSPMNMRTALRGMGLGGGTPQLERSRSTRDAGHRPQTASAKQPGSSSLPSSVGRSTSRPGGETTAPQMTRHPTDSSQGGSASTGRSYFNYGDNDPISPISSNSGSSSWGRKAGNRLQMGSLPPFKFEPAVPPIPGSPASDNRTSRGEKPPAPQPTPTPTPTRHRQERIASKGRSLDLGLSLSWAPQKVREEAVLSYSRLAGGAATSASPGRVKARWKGAMADEQGRLDPKSSRSAADIAKAFEEALGAAAFSTFKTYVHRFDAHAIPLEGPYGLITAASRLLDTAATLDERSKKTLLDKFVRFVQETQ